MIRHRWSRGMALPDFARLSAGAGPRGRLRLLAGRRLARLYPVSRGGGPARGLRVSAAWRDGAP